MSKAELTRHTILLKAFELTYKQGFQATSVNDVIATTKVTKGAFFYHFKTKDEMGVAMIDEVLYPGMHQHLVTPLLDSDNPLEAIYGMMKHLLLEAPFFQVQYGCPAVNLVEEMASINPAFHQALSRLINHCQQALEVCIQKGQTTGKIRSEADPRQVAQFIMVGYSGVRNMGKLYGSSCYYSYLHELQRYLRQLS